VFATGASQTEIAYDAGENPERITQRGFTSTGAPVERTVRMRYNALAQITQIDGPRPAVRPEPRCLPMTVWVSSER